LSDTTSIVAIVSVLGWLVLAVSGYRSHKVSGRKTLMMAAIWIAIFGGLFLLLSVVGG